MPFNQVFILTLAFPAPLAPAACLIVASIELSNDFFWLQPQTIWQEGNISCVVFADLDLGFILSRVAYFANFTKFQRN